MRYLIIGLVKFKLEDYLYSILKYCKRFSLEGRSNNQGNNIRKKCTTVYFVQTCGMYVGYSFVCETLVVGNRRMCFDIPLVDLFLNMFVYATI